MTLDDLDVVLPPDLVAGFHRFRATRFWSDHDRYRQLETEGQRPATMVVACCDSRSSPDAIFDARPGELFIMRNVAGLVPVYEPDTRSHAASAALEYAVLALEVSSILVLGHGRCGGIVAALDATAPLTATDFLGTWVAGLRDLADDLAPADWADPARRHRLLEYRAVEQSLANLRTFPWVRFREEAGRLTLHAAWFDIGMGELHVPGPDGWVPLADA